MPRRGHDWTVRLKHHRLMNFMRWVPTNESNYCRAGRPPVRSIFGGASQGKKMEGRPSTNFSSNFQTSCRAHRGTISSALVPLGLTSVVNYALSVLAIVITGVAQAALCKPDDLDAFRLLNLARQLWTIAGSDYQTGRVRLLLASALLAAGDFSSARAELRAALISAERIGSQRLANQIAETLAHLDTQRSAKD